MKRCSLCGYAVFFFAALDEVVLEGFFHLLRGQFVQNAHAAIIDVQKLHPLTDEVKSSMNCTNAYLNNAQIVVVPADKADQYQTEDSLKDLNFAVEAGSAGEAVATEKGFNATPVKAQSDALMEVAAGTSDAAIIDSLMAAAMVGEGTGYENLTYTIGLSTEEYGVGFRQGSDLTDALNDFLKTSSADGTLEKIAETYGVQAALVDQQ